MSGKPKRAKICPQCGSAANHYMKDGKVACDGLNPDGSPCGFIGITKRFHIGGPRERSRYSQLKDPFTSMMEGGSLWRMPARYQDE